MTQTETGAPANEQITTKAVALVGSAGGLAAIATVLEALPADLDAPVLVLLHLHAGHVSNLAAILGRRTPLAVKQAENGDRTLPSHVYVAPPDSHLRVTGERTLELDQGAPIGLLRPAADVLLASLAEVYGAGTVAVLLSGTGRDGTDGAHAVKLAGGTVIVQDRDSSAFFGMPGAALDAGVVDQVLPLHQIAAVLSAFVRE